MPQFEINGNDLVYTNGGIGAWFCPENEGWYPFRYFNEGVMDVADEEFMMLKPSLAFTIASTLDSIDSTASGEVFLVGIIANNNS